MPRTALVYDAHDYEPGEHSCPCGDGAEHAPCAVCGAGKDAFIHDPEAKESGAMLTVVSADEPATVNEGGSSQGV